MTATATTPPPTTDLALFTRSGNITLPLTAVGQSQAFGSGNLAISLSAQASASLSVTYNFTPASAAALEPGSLALLLPILGTVGMVIRRRRK